MGNLEVTSVLKPFDVLKRKRSFIFTLAIMLLILPFIVRYDMLNARLSWIKMNKEDVEKYIVDISISPLRIPMVASQESITITTVLLGGTLANKGLANLSILLVSVISLLIFFAVPQIIKIIGEKGNKIMIKLMGLIVMVIVVGFFFAGVKPYVQAMMYR